MRLRDTKFQIGLSHRLQHLQLGGVNYVNTYLPTVDTTVEGREKLEAALGDLDEKLNPLILKLKPVILVGDMNLSSAHNPGRQRLFRNFFERHNLKLHTPDVPTNYPRNTDHQPAALDHFACSHHIKEVEADVMGGDRVPVNSSTHLPVVWRFKSEEPTVPNLKEDEEKIKSRRLPRPDWRHKIDLELYRKLEKVYVKTALDSCGRTVEQ